MGWKPYFPQAGFRTGDYAQSPKRLGSEAKFLSIGFGTPENHYGNGGSGGFSPD